MANHQTEVGEDLTWANRQRTVNSPGTSGVVATPANYASITALRTRLNAISATSYSSARLDTMTVNDMIYAVRRNDDSTTI